MFKQQLENLLKNNENIEIISNSVEEGITEEEQIDLVVSTKLLLHKIDKYIPENTKVIFAQRSLSSSSVEKLIQLKEGLKTLLIADNKLSVNETISFLKNIGIDHLDIIPVYPGLDIPEADIAIITGDTSYIPNDLKIINIGRRIIGISTIVRILLELKLLDQYAHILITNYVKQLVELTKKLNKQVIEEQKANKLLEIVLDQVSDGIIYINRNKEVKLINRMATKIFDKNIQGEILNGELLNTDLDEIINKGIKKLNTFQEIGKGKNIVANILPVKHEKDIKGALAICKDVTEIKKLEHDIRRSSLKKKGHIAKYNLTDIVGNSNEIKDLKDRATNLAASNSTILIQGETGTGKEIFAQAIHKQSNYCNGPFVPINCATVPDDLFESELFGYAEGAFTGAKKGGRKGVIEQAHEGTIFLDEIGEIPLNIQSKLLRFLQEEEIMRVGSTDIIPINVRVIAATNRDLGKMVKNKEFREDLYYRINVLPLYIPPLRHRKEDIILLIKYFLKIYGKRELDFSEKALSKLFNYRWPGNVRELKNCVEYIANTCKKKIKLSNLPEYIISDCNNDKQKNNTEIMDLNNLEPGTPEEYIFILNELFLAKQMNKHIGRQEIAQNAKVNGISLSPHMVRTRNNNLEKHGLINIGRGRQGTKITDRGIALFKKLQRNGQ